MTTRTVRHYHRIGLLPEPARAGNDYREYQLRDAVALVRIRRLVEFNDALRKLTRATGPGHPLVERERLVLQVAQPLAGPAGAEFWAAYRQAIEIW